MPDEIGRSDEIMSQPFAALASSEPDPTEFAKKARDLQALRDAVVDAAGVGSGLWLSYLFVFFYLAIAASGVSHRDLFFEHPVKLPFLNVDLPLLGFFVLGPLLFLVVHAYTLLHFRFLAGKVSAFDDELERQIETGDTDTGQRLRRQLPSNIFVQFLAGPPEIRDGVMGFLLRGIAWISLVIGPVLLLVLFQLQFLPFHSEGISWWQRLIVVADLALLWFLWPQVARLAGSFRKKRHVVPGKTWVCLFALASPLPFLLVFTVATFPGEWLDEALPPLPLVPKWASPHALLVGGEANEVTGHARTWWSNRLILPGIGAIDPVAPPPERVSLEGRHLEGAVLIGAHLRNVDFTGAYLKDAVLDYADLREAKFECASTAYRESRMNLVEQILADDSEMRQCADLRGASLHNAQLQGAVLDGSQLQGVWLDSAQLEGASLFEAHLEGAVLNNAQLQGTSLREAYLQGAQLGDAQLQGADLSFAEFPGAWLELAQLQGAQLDRTQLQGAWFKYAKLQDASLDSVFVWRAEPPREVDAAGTLIINPLTGPVYQGYCPSYNFCKWTAKAVTKLEQLVYAAVPLDSWHDEREEALKQIAQLDPGNRSEWQPAAWEHIAQSSPPEKDYEKALAARLQKIGCAAETAPYVISGLIRSSFNNRFTADPARAGEVARAFLDDAHCPGARGLSQQDKAALRTIRDRAAPAKS